MYSEKSGDMNRADRSATFPVVGALRLIELQEPAVPQRRRAPRRRIVAAFLTERRRTDRRNAKPGIDGLLRTVLADDWK